MTVKSEEQAWSRTLLDRLPPVLIALTAAHVALCYLYLRIWISGFGANIDPFFSINDIFSVGLSKILPFYFFLALQAYLLSAYIDADSASGSLKISISPKIFTNEFVKFWKFLAILGALFTLVQLLYKSSFYYFPASFAIGWQLSVLASPFYTGKVNGKPWFNVAIVLLGIFAWLFYWGTYADGFRSRTLSPGELIRSSNFSRALTQCTDGSLIVSQASERFVVVQVDGRRAIYDENCQPFVRIPEAKVTIDLH